jgi:hypothetical protein
MSHWDTSLKRFAESEEKNYVEICNCHNPERFLRYDAEKQIYYGECNCNIEFICAKLQINKHKLILASKRRILDPDYNPSKDDSKSRKSPYDQTLDKFFGE